MRAVLKNSISWMVLATVTSLALPAMAQAPAPKPSPPVVQVEPTPPPPAPIRVSPDPVVYDVVPEEDYDGEEELPPRPPATCGAATTLRSGVAITGRLDQTDPLLAVDSSPYELFCLPVRRGDRIRISLTSADFAPVVQVGPIAIDEPDVCEDCDQAAGSLRAPAIVNLEGERSEVLTVRANTFTGGESGNFSLTATITPAPAPTVQTLAWNTPIDAALIQSDWIDFGTDEEPTRATTDVYAIQLPAGRPVEINMTAVDDPQVSYDLAEILSLGMDPYVSVGRIDANGQFVEIASDDDGGDGINARIRFTPETAGVYQIRARSLSGQAAGDYQLSVGPDTTPPRPAAGAYALGTRQVVTLTDTSPEVETSGGERYRAVDYRVVLQPGTLYRIVAEENAEGEQPSIQVGPYASEAGALITVIGQGGPERRIGFGDIETAAAVATAAAADAAAEQGEVEVLRVDPLGYVTMETTIDIPDVSFTNAAVPSSLFRVEQAGPVVVRVSANSGPGTFAFRIVRVPVAPHPQTVTSLSLPSSTPVLLADGGPRIDGSNQLYAVYAVELTEGQRLSVMFNARTGEGALGDPAVAVGTGSASAFEQLAFNDDSSQDGRFSSNARLVFTAPSTGTFLIRASAYANTDAGSANLRVALLPPAPPPIPIRVGATVEGELTAEHDLTGAEQPFQVYTIELKAGEIIRVRMNGLEEDGLEDPLLMIADGLGAEARVLTSNDDGPEGTNSLLRFRAPSDGTYVIKAASYQAREYGRFELSVEAIIPVTPPPPTPITPGTPVEGTLSTDDPTTELEDTTYDRYVFEAQAGESYVITLRSEDFDSYLLAGPEGTDPGTWAENDDGGGNLNARLLYRVETSGRQVIRVSALGAGAVEGSYTLEVEKRN